MENRNDTTVLGNIKYFESPRKIYNLKNFFQAMSSFSGACEGNQSSLFMTDRGFHSISTAAHELGHL